MKCIILFLFLLFKNSPIEGPASLITVIPGGNPKLTANKLALLVNEEFDPVTNANNMALIFLDKPIEDGGSKNFLR